MGIELNGWYLLAKEGEPKKATKFLIKRNILKFFLDITKKFY